MKFITPHTQPQPEDEKVEKEAGLLQFYVRVTAKLATVGCNSLILCSLSNLHLLMLGSIDVSCLKWLLLWWLPNVALFTHLKMPCSLHPRAFAHVMYSTWNTLLLLFNWLTLIISWVLRSNVIFLEIPSLVLLPQQVRCFIFAFLLHYIVLCKLVVVILHL